MITDIGSLRQGRQGQQDLDARLGRALHQHLQIQRSDAGQREVWSFLTLLVFPDILRARFPDLQRARALGGERNVLYRVWLRQELLGDLARSGPNALREDEFVQLLERRAVARIPHLSRICAEEILTQDHPNRPDVFTRPFMKLVVRLTGPLDLGAVPEDELRGLVARQRQAVLDSL
ncbi:hypothetical protein [Parenemella sanctibonifatiensis]|uniref:hypothetical protein n=1 Tax=Parenemella sanctibonifatiensis TaxID=2016505 RepID=UPI001186D114|nr:hypothetical protein [Parenemella sanctibonifatiensis]